jgi:hypothetical protein
MVETLKILALSVFRIACVYGGFVLLFYLGQKVIDGAVGVLRRERAEAAVVASPRNQTVGELIGVTQTTSRRSDHK